VQSGETQELSSTLAQRFSKNLLHHGLIFQGDPIDSVESQAFKLSRFILGMTESAWEHPDLFHLRPSGKMRIISVEKTRALISDLSRTSNQGGAKIALIHDADRMRKGAANAFLKTLEEPPPGTYSKDGAWWSEGPFTDNPKITTGAGDHFNAGFSIARLCGFSPLTSLAIATCTSGHYVRTAQSPSTGQVVDLLKQGTLS
jgi:sugar/nucleoside kinase (ribokinase family)